MSNRSFLIIASAFLLAGIIVLFRWRQHTPSPLPAPHQPAVQVARQATNLSTGIITASRTNSPVAALGKVATNYPNFQLRPLPVAYESPHFQWTLADGKDTNVIRELAHNQLEYDRMVEENPSIFKRELVYLRQSPAAIFEQARLTGDPVTQVTLPGVDGQELQFQIVQRDGPASSRRGTFSGHLVGDLNSMVTMAFMDGREAFTVIAPKANIFLVGEPREPGQVIVMAINPSTYGSPSGEGGKDFIKTEPNKKK